MNIFRRKPNPSLIDLHNYEHRCWEWKRKGIPIMPPPTIPGGYFTDDEMAIMRDNRREAKSIYDYIRGFQTPLATLDVMEHFSARYPE